jgi:glutamyl-tRNA(Gln) amidotransferase subunit E
MKIGFEIHQQLATKKLFCDCPSELKEDEPDVEFVRRLRPTQSELGEIDQAALQEFLKGKAYRYQAYSDTTCIVEHDDEPPHTPNQDALEIALGVAMKLGAEPVEEVHFMRKLVIDGSNTAGFQRTAVVAFDGQMEIDGTTIGVPTICFEEEAARKISESGKETIYRLDRLGIPLVEITTTPDIQTPKQARDAALKMGRILREFNVKRGLGTIRQDVNVSVEDGARIEIKGVQDLNQIPDMIEGEANRQRTLIEVKGELKKRKPKIKFEVVDVTGIFKKTDSKVIKGQVKKGNAVMALKLAGFNGLLLKKLGPEFAGYARAQAGVKGIFHTDELPAYGITEGEVKKVKEKLKLKEEDAFVLVAEKERRAKIALDAVFNRAKAAFKGVPEETRMANPDGTTRYMRPLPGAARMYPETDIPPIVISGELLDKVRSNLPESYENKIARYIKEYKLSEEMATQMVNSQWTDFFEKVAVNYGVTTMAATTLLGTLTEQRREGVPVENVTEEKLTEIFKSQAEGKISKEAIPDVIRELAKNPQKTVEEITEKKFEAFGEKEITEIVQKIIKERGDFVKDKGLASIGPLMGPVMGETKGRADGKIVNDILKKEIEKFLK